MTIETLLSAGAFSALGLVAGKLADIWITRANAKDSNSVTLVNHTSEQTKVLIDQLRSLIVDLTANVKELTADRNGLQMDVFRITPMAQKMTNFEEELGEYGMTLEDCIILIRETTLPDGASGKRWTDRARQQRARVVLPVVPPKSPDGQVSQ